MKKKLLIAVVAAFAICMAGLAACKDGELNLIKVEAAAPTCGADGHITYYYDEKSGNCYSDEKGENIINITDTVIERTGEHSYGDDGKCVDCGAQLVNEGLVYTLSADGCYYSLTSAQSCFDSVIFVPELYNGVPVEKIGANAFYGCTAEKIIVDGNVDEIGVYAFGKCTELKQVVLPNSLYTVQDYAFYGCTSLESIEVPVGVKYIGACAFEGCTSLKSAVLPERLLSLGAGAFAVCSSLSRVTLPQNITVIADDLFNGCTYLKSVNFAGDVTSIGARAFKDCNRLADITLPESLTYIGEYAFASSALSDVIIPDSVTAIGERAFSQCDKLKYLTLGEGLKSIGDKVFSDCPILIGINYNVISIDDFNGESALFENSGRESVGITLTVGAKVESIPAYAFTRDISADVSYSPSIASIVFESRSDCNCIGKYAFYYCSKLTAVTLPVNCASVGDYAFANCSSLATVTLPQKLTDIGAAAFTSSDITEITIPDNVTSIGNGAFCFCNKLADINLGSGLTSVGKNAFYSTAHYNDAGNWDNGTYYVGTVAAYTTVGQSKNESLIIKDGTTIIADSASEFKYITEVYIPASVKYIGSYAFRMCVNLKKVTFESGSQLIETEENAFSGCVSLTDIPA